MGFFEVSLRSLNKLIIVVARDLLTTRTAEVSHISPFFEPIEHVS
jgi:hypothetical protein